MKTNAVIFDRDGVLTYFDVELAQSFFQPLLPFSIYDLAQRWQKWGMNVGFPSTIEEEQAFFAGFWRHLHRECNLSENQYRALAACNYTDFIRSYPEVPTILRELKRHSIPIGVLSNFSLASLDTSLVAVGIRDWIDVACAAPVIGYAKPQAEAYRYVARLLDREPNACFFFDDEAPCVAGARETGMMAYLVDRKLSHNEREDYVVQNLNAVLDLLL